MSDLKSVIEGGVYVAIVLYVFRTYLILNKLWARRHSKEVCESISVMALLVSYGTTIPFFLHRVLNGHIEGAVQDGMALGYITIMLLIGSGVWVKGQKRQGFWALFRRALRLERGEAADLLKNFIHPKKPKEILDILGRIALIDNRLDEREILFVTRFAEEWGIPLSWDELKDSVEGDERSRFVALRESVSDYLATHPPNEQVTQLRDAVTALIHIDEQVADEETLIADELNGLFDRYIGSYEDATNYAVVLAPQAKAQEEAIAALLPQVRRSEVAGGVAIVAGHFNSRSYATMIRDNYRTLGVLSFVEQIPFVPGQAQPAQWWRASTAWAIPSDLAGALDEED